MREKTSRILRSFQEKIIDTRLLDMIERKICHVYRLTMPPTFIVGPPRSGSTLVYQILVLFYKFSYLTNFSALCPSLPGTMTLLSRPLYKPQSRLKPSNYGFISGPWSPNEGGAIMSKWFGDRGSGNPWISVAAISEITDAPFINKNTYNSGRINKILQYFPKAIILHVWRDLLSNVASCYRTARQFPGYFFGYYPIETSLVPTNDIFSREVNRVVQIHREILAGLNSSGFGVVDVQYEALCDNPSETLKNIEKQFISHGLKLERRKSILPKLKKGNSTSYLNRQEMNTLKKLINETRKDCQEDMNALFPRNLEKANTH